LGNLYIGNTQSKVTTAANFGVRNTAPSQALDVTGSAIISGTITVSNAYILPPLTNAPTWSQIGVSNSIFIWSSNDIPPTTYGSYYNVSSNLVNKWSL
jgi:hypothetical protein